MDGFVNFYFHWLKPFGGWLVVFVLTLLPALWLFNDSDLRLLPTRSWRLGVALIFLLFIPTLLLGVNAVLNPGIGINPRAPEAQFGAALGLVMLVLIWVMVGCYVIIYWGMIGSESGFGVYDQGQPDPYLTQAQISALGGQMIHEANLFPQRAYANAFLIDQNTQTQHPLLKGQTRMGRSRQNDIVLSHDCTVSRRHGMIWETSGAYVLHNYSSDNPISYNGTPMTQGQTCLLRGGDILQLGRTRMTFSISALMS